MYIIIDLHFQYLLRLYNYFKNLQIHIRVYFYNKKVIKAIKHVLLFLPFVLPFINRTRKSLPI